MLEMGDEIGSLDDPMVARFGKYSQLVNEAPDRNNLDKQQSRKKSKIKVSRRTSSMSHRDKKAKETPTAIGLQPLLRKQNGGPVSIAPREDTPPTPPESHKQSGL